MCIATSGIKFCTCKKKDVGEFSVGKWVLYRYTKNIEGSIVRLNDGIVGMVETIENLDSYSENQKEIWINSSREWRSDVQLAKYFESRLNNDLVFDFKFQCESGDYLLIKLKNRVLIELFYNSGAWGSIDEISPFRDRCRIMKGKALIKLQINDEVAIK